MAQQLIRVLYAVEFLLAVISSMQLWREVGGQSHLDLMPWFFKLFLIVGFSGAVVKLTSVSLQQSRGRTLLWTSIVALFLVAAGLITFYYHLNEPLESDEDGTGFTTQILKLPATIV